MRVIIAGAGSAGMTAAWLLSEDPLTEVVLVEAGSDPGPEVPASVLGPVPPDDWYWRYRDMDDGQVLDRGRGVGGSSVVNHAGATRGGARSYDRWGVPGWGWSDCLPALRALEADEQFGDEPYHGAAGPVPVLRWPVGPVDLGIRDVYARLGYGEQPDHNAPSGTGFGPFPNNRPGGVRASTLVTMAPVLRDRPNVRILPNRDVRRVVLSGGTASGVEIALPDGATSIVEGDLVVLAGGAYGSPEILFSSGIGAGDELRAAGIDVRVDAPEVGKNLREHPFASLPVRIDRASDWASLPRDPNLLTVAPGDDGDALAHVFPFRFKAMPEHQMVFVGALVSSTSTGRLVLGTRPAGVRRAMLSTGHDRRQMLDVLRRVDDVVRLFEERGALGVPDDAWWRTEDPLAAATGDDITGYDHPAGTCRMGADEDSVVDPALRVRHVNGLMVADASVFPDIPRAQTNFAAMMVGYRAAELIRTKAG